MTLFLTSDIANVASVKLLQTDKINFKKFLLA